MKIKCELVISNIADEIVAVPVGEGAKSFHLVLKLNEEGQKIIELLRQDTSVEEICTEIMREYSSEDDQIREYVIEFINQLREYGLIEE